MGQGKAGWPGWARRAAAVLCLCWAAGSPAAPGEIHEFKQRDGVRLFTDQKRVSSGAVYIGLYGRPPATHACRGMTPGLLKTRAQSYESLIGRHASTHGVPPELVRAVMQVESCFDRHAVSKVGARGLMQLMPETAAELGVRDSFDPAQNIAGGVRYLGMMRKRYADDWNLVLAAYNAGPGAVDKHGGIPPYRETQHYVKRVMGLFRQAQQPATAQPLHTRATP